jgi:DNA polymerase alpha subunit B
MDVLPKQFQKLAADFPSDGQAKLLEVYNQYHFSEAQVECFKINASKLSKDNLEAFRKYLEQELAKTTKLKSATPTPVRTSMPGALSGLGIGAKRKAALPGGIAAAVGRAEAPTSQVSSTAEVNTPLSKRQRESDDAELASVKNTPEPPSRPAPVSLKSSVNGQLQKPVLDNSMPVQIRLLGDASLWTGEQSGRAYRWMDEAVEDRALAQDAQLSAMEGAIIAAVRARPSVRLSLVEGEDEVAAGTVGVSSQAEVILCGRLVCEGLEGRLNERSILLEGSRASSNGARIHLYLQGCSHVAAFPGQIVGVLGRSGEKSTFHARDFVPGIPAPMPIAAPRADAQMHLMVAAGPYCLRDTLDYTPLEQVLAHAANVQPKVLVLLGPFLDAGNVKVNTGETVIAGETKPRPFEEVYTEFLLPLLARCLAPLRQRRPATEVLLVPSLEEALCFHPLPQPPMDASLCVEARAFSQLRSIVKFLPNPAHLEVNGLKVSLSSADALSPVLREIVLRPAERKIEEALRLLLGQRSLFSVLPRDPPQVSEARAGALQFPFADNATPDLCIFPAIVGQPGGMFVDGTAFVNPGVLCRGSLGTFAEVFVVPDASRAAQGGRPLLLSERTRVDVMKLA